MAFLHYFVKIVIHFFLHVFWIFPIKKNRITLLNNMSHTYGDSMKYLNEFIRKHLNGKYEIIYPLKNVNGLNEKGFKPVKANTLQFYYYLLTSSIIITNSGGVSYLPFRKKQLGISTWHGGGPYKKTGNAVFQNKWYDKEMKMHRRNIKFILSSCKMFTDIEAKAMLFDEDSCISSGMPRNDIFFERREDIRKKVFEYCKISESTKLVLFAPTFRTNVHDYTDSQRYHTSGLDFDRLIRNLNIRFGNNEWKVGIRLHPTLVNVELNIPNTINLTKFPDIQELLYSSDILITDFSSLMWDYSLTKKPCFLYADDIDEYERERGFYMPSKKWPYPIARNNDDLEQNILNFDLENYINAVEKHHEECGSYEQGHACEMTMKLIDTHYENIK